LKRLIEIMYFLFYPTNNETTSVCIISMPFSDCVAGLANLFWTRITMRERDTMRSK